MNSALNFNFEAIFSRHSLAALLAVVVPNTIFNIVSMWLDVSRPWLNVDYTIAATFLAFGRTRIGLALALIFAAIDSLQIVNQIYPFIRLSDLAVLLQLLPNASPWHWGVFSFSIFAVASASGSVAFLARKSGRTHSLIVLNLFFCALAVSSIIHPESVRTVWRVERTGAISSESLFFLQHRITGNAAKFFARGNPIGEKTQRASSALAPRQDARPVLLVMAESWGVFRDPALAEVITRPIRLLAEENRSVLEEGTLHFIGATVAAEVRELCGVSLLHLNMRELRDDVPLCLPQLFRMNGYRTISLHAALGSIYGRRSWYPKIGFDETRFKEQGRWSSECKSFPGACDSELARADLKELLAQSDEKIFIYWLTLNSHQPYRGEDIRQQWVSCPQYDIALDSEACRMVQLHAQFFADLATALRQAGPPSIELMIVGDHRPPLLNTKDASALVTLDSVPWLHLTLN